MKVNATTIMELRRELLETVWLKAHQNWRKSREYFDRKHKIKVGAPDAEKLLLGLARSKVLSMADTLVTDNPLVERKAKASKESQRQKDEDELWGQGGLRELCLPLGLQPPFKTAGAHIALYGYVVAGLRWNEARWGTMPEDTASREAEQLRKRRRSIFPFELVVPHPARILMPPFERQPSFAIETGTYTVAQAKRDYPQLASKLRGKDFEFVELVIFQSNDDFAVLCAGEMGFKRLNMLGFTPYLQAFNSRGLEGAPTYSVGGGNIPTEAGANPADFAVGLLDHALSSINGLDTIATGVLHQTMSTLYRKTYVSGPDAQSVAEQMEDAQTGAIITMPNTDRPIDQVISQEKPAMIDPQAWEIIQLFRQDIGESTYGGEVQGRRSPGVDTATQHAIMLGMSRQGFDVAVQQLNFLGAKVLEYMGRMIEARQETVWVDHIAMTGNKLEGDHNWVVNFNKDDEATLLRRGAEGREERKLGLIDFRGYQEMKGRGDAALLRERLWLERNEDAPDVDAFVRQSAMFELARERGVPPPMLPGQASPSGPTGPGTGVRATPAMPFVPTRPASGAQMLEGATVTPGAGMSRAEG